jgi:hypothetical protein
MQRESGSQLGFGGDLRYGETGAGAGLRGADKLCAAIAESSLPGAGAKGWRAFLSATADENGRQVDAIDRIGEGPWYDRLGRVLATTRSALLAGDRPAGADALIRDDFPNVSLIEMGPPQRTSNTVGSGGGYGAIYCFALTP